MSYERIDSEIIQWANKNGLTLFVEWNEKPHRFVYFTNKLNQSYQISIRPYFDDVVIVDIGMIEGNELFEFRCELTANLDNTREILNISMSFVKQGFDIEELF